MATWVCRIPWYSQKTGNTEYNTSGLGKRFMQRATLKILLLPAAACITPIIALKTLTETFYIS